MSRSSAAARRVISVPGLRANTSQEALAYNLIVNDIHTFHVGQHDILVHNACGPLSTRQLDEFGKRIADAAPATRRQTDELAD